MVSHVQVIAILMIVQGALASLMGLLCGAMGPTMWAMFHFSGKRPEPDDELMLQILPAIYLAGGILALLVGVLTLIAGIRCLKFRGRTLILVALFANVVPVFSGYCAPTSLTVLIYGLIVMFNSEVARAFEMVEGGMTPEEVRAHFRPQYGYGRVRRRPDWDEDEG